MRVGGWRHRSGRALPRVIVADSGITVLTGRVRRHLLGKRKMKEGWSRAALFLKIKLDP